MRTFYVDSVNGSDAGSGLFEAEAWKSVERANASTFGPGDSLLFKCGGRYEGMLVPKGNGAKGNPVTIGAYGEGDAPVIDGCGAYAGILLEGVNHYIVTGLCVKNHAEERAIRQGIAIIGAAEGITEDITIVNNEITDVTGENRRAMGPYKAMYWNGGVYVSFPTRTSKKDHLHDIFIMGNYIHDVLTSGIRVNQAEDFVNDIHHTHVVVSGNRVLRTGSDGIIVANCISPRISGNVCGEAGYHGTLEDTKIIAGIWVCATSNALIERNEVYGTRMFENDGSAFDTDWGTAGDTVFQYNYSHDNEGGFWLDCIGLNRNIECGKTILRYNISINDGRGIGIYDQGMPVELYGNLFKFDHPMRVCIFGTPVNYHFTNNIFDLSEEPVDGWQNAVYEDNFYSPDEVPGLKEALVKLTEDPKEAFHVTADLLAPIVKTI